MSTFRYRLLGVTASGLDSYVEAGSGATVALLARPPWTEITLADDTREPDLDEFMAGFGYTPDVTGPIVLVTVDHVMGTESVVLVDATAGPVNVTLPLVSSRIGDELVITKIDVTTNAVTVTPSGGDTIGGAASQTFTMQGQTFRVVGDDTAVDWFFESSRRATDIVFDNTGTVIPGTTVQDAISQVVSLDLTALETFIAGEVLSSGHLVVLNAAGEVMRANSSIAADNWKVIGVTRTSALFGASVEVFTKFGASVQTRFAVAPAGASNGQLIFLSSTSGQAILTPPTSSGNSIFSIGVLQGADGVTVTPTAIFHPQLVALRV